MTWVKSDRLVPVRDRRQRRRILTLKNLRNAFLVVLALFAGITIQANLRGRNAPKDEYGRLYRRQIERTKVAPKQQEVISEAPINDADHADPMLIRAQARAQFLQADPNALVEAQVANAKAMAQQALPRTAGQEHVTIVGGPEGVQLVKKNTEPPVLGGGFGRP